MQNRQRRPLFPPRPDTSNANVTSAIGMEESTRYRRTRKKSLFTQTVMWFTGLICLAFLLGTLAQAWSNSQLMQKVQSAQQQLDQLQIRHNQLVKAAEYYKDPTVVETEARQKLGYIRQGEHPVLIVGSNNKEKKQAPVAINRPTQPAFWQEWWQLFFSA